MPLFVIVVLVKSNLNARNGTLSGKAIFTRGSTLKGKNFLLLDLICSTHVANMLFQIQHSTLLLIKTRQFFFC